VLLLLIAAAASTTAAVVRRYSGAGWPLLVAASATVLGLIALTMAAFNVPTYPRWLAMKRNGTLHTATPFDDYADNIDNGVGYAWYLIFITGLVLATSTTLRLRQRRHHPAEPTAAS
jgi:hypothetical protein